MKKVAVSLEHRFYEYDGKLYTKLAFPYAYWCDYLNYFDQVTVVARVKNVDTFTSDMVRVDGENVSYEKLVYFRGMKEFLLKSPFIIAAIFKVALKHKFFLLRSGNSTNFLWLFLFLLNKPYLREYPGNVKEGMIGVIGEKLWVKALANILDGLARFQGKFSKANSFVSQYCKDLYSSKRPSFVFSSFKFSEINCKKLDYKVQNKIKIVSLGRLEGEKGHASLLQAIHLLNQKNIEIHLIGDGAQKKTLEALAEQLSINVVFYGALTDRDKIFSILNQGDIYVIPSLTEGMPRSLLEAMAIGLPCIGSTAGGIPEVLAKDVTYEPNNIKELASLIEKFGDAEELRQFNGLKNLEFVSHEYGEAKLLEQKKSFWSKVYE
ncbi:glycosyltransferase family 4 protein [Acinetobacter bohemicus]|uniref:Glycosyltransferase involved in cell wall bisynthesis n=1 Tax=Acinetobacter bohemicus TaxID=1435036 RepID=A0A1I6TAT9_9GAMM|nr:glycosyltransferase [Acinetobacter bohemicus]KAB0652778.1 glycosyltransferase family 4 protein [Acinetobacter bohemicus]SFS86107.1 Glycosyltransferase involved in cell wall bisynthesis [Acinetobacter bohemicus]